MLPLGGFWRSERSEDNPILSVWLQLGYSFVVLKTGKTRLCIQFAVLRDILSPNFVEKFGLRKNFLPLLKKKAQHRASSSSIPRSQKDRFSWEKSTVISRVQRKISRQFGPKLSYNTKWTGSSKITLGVSRKLDRAAVVELELSLIQCIKEPLMCFFILSSPPLESA